MRRNEKRGLSPVIATVLLVAIALVLAIIIFLWARNFVGESIEKGGRDIGQSCEETIFRAEIILSQEKLFIENTGRVPLFGAELRKKKLIGEITFVGTFENNYILAGETGEIGIGDVVGDLEAGDDVIVVPVLLGETQEYKKAHVCDKAYGVEIKVKS